MKVLKAFLILMAVLLLVSLIFAVVLLLDLPWWMGFFLFLILVGLGIGFLFLRKIWLRRREQQFVQQVIEQDESRLKVLSGKEKDDQKEVQDRWKEAVEALKRSHLRKHGNPLYVLPWYMVLGESGSGKTTAIGSARLSSPFVEVKRTSGISGTKNCDWWFFEQAIILDTAGRYAIPIDEGRDKEEWQRFITLLVKYRKKEPLHGLVVAIAADKLLQATPEVLGEEGRQIRRRIDELMRVLGIRFPIYVLVTKCDLVQGMTQFCDRLPEKSLDQPMGFINQDLTTDVTDLAEKAIQTLGERLRNLRILLLHQPEWKGSDPGLLLFPEEFENLKRGLSAFIQGAFQENPYQETPILRGIFFTSGRQEGSPYSHFLNALGLIGEKEILPGTNRGLFLHDLFAKILPKERGLFAPTRRAVEWHRLTRNLGLTAWVVLGIALCGLLSFSFVKNLKIIREVSHDFAKPLTLRGELPADVATMDRFYQAIVRVEKQNRNWWIPRFGLNESLKAEKGLKDNYCKQFKEGFLTSFDKQMSAQMATLSVSTSDEVIGQTMTHLVRRINLLRARLEDQRVEVLQSKPQPSYDPLLFKGAQAVVPEMKKRFGQLYLYYLVWRLDRGDLNREIAILQSWLKDILTVKRGNLRWLVVWADQQGVLSRVTLEQFWGGSAGGSGEKSVTPAFTRKGRDLILSFVKELEMAIPDTVNLVNQKSDFERWYRTACFEVWQNFIATFPKGAERLRGLKEWQPMATRMTTDEGPYSLLLNKIALELELIVIGGGGDGGEGVPFWLQQVYQFQAVKTLSKTQGAGGGILGKAAEEGKKMVGTIEKRLGKDVGGETLESQLSAAKAYQEYQNALTQLAPVTASRNQAYQIALQTYGEDQTTGKSPVLAAYRAVHRLRTSMAKGRPGEELFGRLMTGPLEYLWTYIQIETACHLQNQWEEKVLAESQGVTGQQAVQLLLGPEGLAWKFLKGVAEPFVGRSPQRGYYAKEVMGGSVPFEASFFSFLTRGAQASALTKQSYNVLIKGLPTDANPEARLKPHSTKLELQCTGGNQALVNFNYPVSKTFQWSPESCGDVLLQVEVGNLVLTKKYSGSYAFLDFLQDFQGGRHHFRSQEFPGERAALEGLRLESIHVNYQFGGDQHLLGQFRSIPGQAPRNIVKCWE